MNHDQESFDEDSTRYLGDWKLWGRLLKFFVPQWRWILLAVGAFLHYYRYEPCLAAIGPDRNG